MSDRTFEILKLLFDKVLLAGAGGLIAYWFGRASDRKRDQAAWSRARADQRLATYREINLILASQLVGMQRFSNIVEVANTRPENVDPAKAQEFATKLFKEIAATHFENASALLVAAPFMGQQVAKPLMEYQKIAGRFSRIVEPSFGDGADPVSFAEIRSLMEELTAAWYALQFAIRDEFNTHPGLERDRARIS